MKYWPYLLTMLVMLVIFGSRWFGPSDLYDNDQPKTVAYTVDMVRHGHWLLPVDMLGRPATKPPMYNWIGAPVVAAGWHSEFALKLPSTLAALVTVLLTWHFARRAAVSSLGRGGPFYWEGEVPLVIAPAAVASIACICLLANYCIAKLSYTARPDMLLTAFTTGGWLAATSLLMHSSGTIDSNGTSNRSSPEPTLGLQLLLWLCVAGAGLTKGLPALLVVIYVLIGAKLLGGGWSSIRRTGILWGLPLALGLIGLWACGAYISNPEHFTGVFMGDEVVARIGRGGLMHILSDLWVMPAMFVAKFFPWSVFACMGIWHVIATRPRPNWFAGPVGAAILWVILVIVFFSLSGGKRADYIAPACPAGAVLASLWLVHEGRRLLRLRALQSALAGLCVAVLIGAYELSGMATPNETYGRDITVFVRRVQQQTQGQPIRFQHTEYTPIQALLGYNQPNPGPAASLDAPWLIKPLDEPGAVIVSDPIWIGGETTDIIMALYTVERLRFGSRGTPAH